MNPKPLFQRSADTGLLMSRLRDCSVGEMIPYGELSKVIGRDVRNGASGALASACKILEREEAIVFVRVRGAGAMRVDDKGKVKSCRSMTVQAHRKARRALSRLGAVDLSKLDDASKTEFNAVASVAAAVDAMGSNRGIAKIEKRVSQTGERLPLGLLLDEFKK